MKKIVISVLFMSVLCMGTLAQAQRNLQVTNQQQQNYQTYGYCLTGIDMSADVKAKVEKLQVQHQADMVPLRTKMRSTRDWDVKNQVRTEMNTMRTTHQKEIWALVPAAKNNALNRQLGQGRGQGNPGLGQGRGGGRGAGQAVGRGAGRGANRGAARAGGGRRWK